MAAEAVKLATYQTLKSAVAKREAGRYPFGAGLYCIVTASGNAAWRCNYVRDGSNQVATLGHFPAMSVTQAQAARETIRHAVRAGGDPRAERHAARAERKTDNAATVETIGRAWLRNSARSWTPDYAKAVERRLITYVYPEMGQIPVRDVSRQSIIDLLTTLDDKHHAQAVHVRQHMSGVFEYALDIGRLEVNPVQRVARRLPKRVKGENETQAHVETIEAARNVLAVIEAAKVQPASLLAHRFIALTAVRKMEAVEAEWSEVDFAAQTWTIPARRMKGRRGQKREHVVTLSPQALDVLHAARQLAPAESTLVFPSAHGKALAASKLNDLMVGSLRRANLGGSHTVHGWRATFSTILNEADPTNYRVIDVSLAHKAFSGVEAHYNHARYLAERRRVACAWADMLMVGAPSAWALVGLEEPSNVVPFREAA